MKTKIILMAVLYIAFLITVCVDNYKLIKQINVWENYYDYSFKQHTKDLNVVKDCIDRDVYDFCECSQTYPIIHSTFNCN